MDKVFKILQVGLSRNIGGVETYLIEQYRHLDRSRIDYDFINMIGETKIAFEDEIKDNWQLDTTFEGSISPAKRDSLLMGWRRAVKCAINYTEE